jgi:predicted class III extradiol MEMO1 family dioxygenase
MAFFCVMAQQVTGELICFKNRLISVDEAEKFIEEHELEIQYPGLQFFVEEEA